MAKICIISFYRYRPFQQQLRILGVYDYIDRPQYEKLCILWNTIKAETQIVEMYFNQISLLIYPVVSSTTLPFLESVDNEDVSALIKINAIIHTLISYDEKTSAATLKKNVSRLLKSDSTVKPSTTSTPYFNEEELGVFIVNSIIEPLFEEEESTKSPFKTTTRASPKKNDHFLKKVANNSLTSSNTREKGGNAGTGPTAKKVLRCMSPEISDFVLEHGMNQLQVLKNNWFTSDLCNIFKMDDQLLLSNIFSNPRIKSLVGDDKGAKFCDNRGGATDATKKLNRAGDNFRSIRCDNQKRSTFQRKYPKKGYDKKFTFGNYEFINKKFNSNCTMTTPMTPSSILPNGMHKNFV